MVVQLPMSSKPVPYTTEAPYKLFFEMDLHLYVQASKLAEHVTTLWRHFHNCPRTN